MRRVCVWLVALSLWAAIESAPATAHAEGFWDGFWGSIATVLVIGSAIALGAALVVGSTLLPLIENTGATLDGVQSSGGWRAMGYVGGVVDLAIGVPCLYEAVRLSARGERSGAMYAIGVPTTLFGIGNLTMATTSQLQPARP